MAAPKRFRRARTRRNPEVLKVRLARRQRKAEQRGKTKPAGKAKA
jgi:hypothetical protein